MRELFGAGPELPYARRKALLIAHRVAVWDVLRSCRREGSLDTAIHRDSEVANDFQTFFRRHRRIGVVFFNGQKAEAAFRRHVLPELNLGRRALRFERLPSTSPAHAGRSRAEKLAAWRAVSRAVTS